MGLTSPQTSYTGTTVRAIVRSSCIVMPPSCTKQTVKILSTTLIFCVWWLWFYRSCTLCSIEAYNIRSIVPSIMRTWLRMTILFLFTIFLSSHHSLVTSVIFPMKRIWMHCFRRKFRSGCRGNLFPPRVWVLLNMIIIIILWRVNSCTFPKISWRVSPCAMMWTKFP